MDEKQVRALACHIAGCGRFGAYVFGWIGDLDVRRYCPDHRDHGEAWWRAKLGQAER